MVEKINYQKRDHYYCEDWCRENNSCNVEITSHSIKKTLEDLSELR